MLVHILACAYTCLFYVYLLVLRILACCTYTCLLYIYLLVHILACTYTCLYIYLLIRILTHGRRRRGGGGDGGHCPATFRQMFKCPFTPFVFFLLAFFSIMLFFPTPPPPIKLPYPAIPLPYPSLLSCLILSSVVKLPFPCPPFKTFLSSLNSCLIFCPALKCTTLPFVKLLFLPLFRVLALPSYVLKPPVERKALPDRRYRYTALAGHIVPSCIYLFIVAPPPLPLPNVVLIPNFNLLICFSPKIV